MKTIRQLLRHPRITTLIHWEFWPFWAVYLPMLPWWLLECIRCRSLGFFAAANPGIPFGGLMGESKKDIHAILPSHLYPSTLHFEPGTQPSIVIPEIQAAGMSFPMIGKPDIGGKGRGVKRLDDVEALEAYASVAVMAYHIQPFVPLEREVGIFYHRIPGGPMGVVSGIVGKEFMTVTGDGYRSIRELLADDLRGAVYLNDLARSMGDAILEVPAPGEIRQVAHIGNHARGARFIDLSDQISPELNSRMDRIADQIPGFCFGRFDIRYRTWEAFLRGEDFMVIEVNGAGSEPTHMYDPSHGPRFAWREIKRHWEIMGRIARANKTNGHVYLTFRECLRMLFLERRTSALLKQMPI
ncbi:MAG: hypothetical protein ACOVQS_11140 [Chitinophagaceae bacterium]